VYTLDYSPQHSQVAPEQRSRGGGGHDDLKLKTLSTVKPPRNLKRKTLSTVKPCIPRPLKEEALELRQRCFNVLAGKLVRRHGTMCLT